MLTRITAASGIRPRCASAPRSTSRSPATAEEHGGRRAHPGHRRGICQESRRHPCPARADPRERRGPHHGMAGGFRGDGNPSPPLLASLGPVPGQRNQPRHAGALPRCPPFAGAARRRLDRLEHGAGRRISGPACTTATGPRSSSPCSSAAVRRTCSVSMPRSRSTAISAAARPWPRCCSRARRRRPTASRCSNFCPRCRRPGTPAKCAASRPRRLHRGHPVEGRQGHQLPHRLRQTP